MFNSMKLFIKYVVIIALAVIITAVIIINIPNIYDNIVKFFNILTPFYIGFAIAYILNRPIKLLNKHFKIKIPLATGLVYLTLIILIALFSAFILPYVVNNGLSLGNEISKGVSQLIEMFQNYNFGPLQNIVNQNVSRIAEFLTTISNFIVVNFSTFVINFTSAFMNTLFGIIISIYMLIGKQKNIRLFKRLTIILFGESRGQIILEHFSEANIVFSHFISGLIVEAITVGILAYIGMSLLGVRYAIILALIMTFTNTIPYVGPFIGAIPAITVTLLYDPSKALWLAIFIVILQQVDGNLIGPRIMGNYIGLDPIWIILSITIGGGFFGVIGVLLAIPTGAFLKIVISRVINKYNDTHYNL